MWGVEFMFWERFRDVGEKSKSDGIVVDQCGNEEDVVGDLFI